MTEPSCWLSRKLNEIIPKLTSEDLVIVKRAVRLRKEYYDDRLDRIVLGWRDGKYEDLPSEYLQSRMEYCYKPSSCNAFVLDRIEEERKIRKAVKKK